MYDQFLGPVYRLEDHLLRSVEVIDVDHVPLGHIPLTPVVLDLLIAVERVIICIDLIRIDEVVEKIVYLVGFEHLIVVLVSVS